MRLVILNNFPQIFNPKTNLAVFLPNFQLKQKMILIKTIHSIGYYYLFRLLYFLIEINIWLVFTLIEIKDELILIY
jgi:hypothetical protein